MATAKQKAARAKFAARMKSKKKGSSSKKGKKPAFLMKKKGK